ncbi:gluconate 2-dehydrogenase subunit 3 family protein [Swingsia samuiensis]|uniref:Gluconate 2-dehydrogenase subunit 3 family protein n=1 Tax=Swingsia samuiensis TaxID=1293412 RepID=A0A4Y6UJB6_9PROT|nr:gluconate 2-dehydrogenase subunit 3 family protein [Swingsia samuiensis]QDH16910.1 gluconate 2-dehydrogenase subunit 3 family protein [Swingsia samuiensis]
MPSSISPPFMESNHISTRTRKILETRSLTPEPLHSRNLSSLAFSVLSSIIPALLPQENILKNDLVELAAQIDQALSGSRDGWRFAELPSDIEAWEQALLTLEDISLSNYKKNTASLSINEIHSLFDKLYAGTIGVVAPHRFNAQQMQKWYSDFRAETLECFLSHAHVQDALGISSSLTGGDDVFQGFVSVTPNTREAFEPVSPQSPLPKKNSSL